MTPSHRLTASKTYCETCKIDTEKCQYYPAGRSRQHGACLECDRTDPRSMGAPQSTDARYCKGCDRARRTPPGN
jgi:hypothetical protein